MHKLKKKNSGGGPEDKIKNGATKIRAEVVYKGGEK